MSDEESKYNDLDTNAKHLADTFQNLGYSFKDLEESIKEIGRKFRDNFSDVHFKYQYSNEYTVKDKYKGLVKDEETKNIGKIIFEDRKQRVLKRAFDLGFNWDMLDKEAIEEVENNIFFGWQREGKNSQILLNYGIICPENILIKEKEILNELSWSSDFRFKWWGENFA